MIDKIGKLIVQRRGICKRWNEIMNSDLMEIIVNFMLLKQFVIGCYLQLIGIEPFNL